MVRGRATRPADERRGETEVVRAREDARRDVTISEIPRRASRFVDAMSLRATGEGKHDLGDWNLYLVVDEGAAVRELGRLFPDAAAEDWAELVYISQTVRAGEDFRRAILRLGRRAADRYRYRCWQ